MSRVLLVQPSLQPPGGGNGVAAWALQALVGRHQVSVLSWRPVEVESINRFFGTHLEASDFDRMVVPQGVCRLVDAIPLPLALLKTSMLMRYTRRVSPAYDVILGIHNEIDHGRFGIQYVHYPTYLRPRPQADLRWYHRPRAVLHAYYGLADRIARFSIDRMRGNLTLANSAWTAEKIRQLHGVQARVVYPPVSDPLPSPPWGERASTFLAVGRLSPEKAWERVMRILARAREQHPGITLVLVGTWDRTTRRYAAWLRRLAASLGPWITVRSDLSRDELRGLMAGARYGIHGMEDEHFGMAAAEMVRAGLIVWVPDSGGQVEIVGDEPALRFTSDDDAVAKVGRVLASDEEQARLRAYLARQGARFSVDRFCREIRAVIDEAAQM
jgi:glycosyltransferase involved in cell wall biosynthesis